MKKVFLCAALALAGGMLASAERPVFVRAERESGVYKVGETIVFQVRKWTPGLQCTYTVTDGVKTTEPAPLTQDPISVKAEAPGFVFVQVECGRNAQGKPVRTYAGAAIEPEKIVPGAVCPEDFDAFWDGQLAELRKSPLEVIHENPIPESFLPKGCKGFDVEVRRGDVTATGFLVLPADAKPGSLPGLLTFLGASKVNAELPPKKNPMFRKIICFNLNFHGLQNTPEKDKEIIRASKRKVKNYRYIAADSRQDYAMRKIFLRTVVAADYLRQRPEFDGKTLAASGGSLGGCQALVCSALVPEVKFCVSNATAMCDHYGAQAGHLPGWPNLLRKVPEARENAAYFDVVNFVHRVHCPVRMAVGFVDGTCPPASTYAAYNTVQGDKKIRHSVTGLHGQRLDKRDTGVFQFWKKELADFLLKK